MRRSGLAFAIRSTIICVVPTGQVDSMITVFPGRRCGAIASMLASMKERSAW